MKVTIDMVILIVSSANTLGIVLLLIFYCTQIRYLKKKLIGLGMRPSTIKNKASSDLGQMIKTRPRSNSWVVGTHSKINSKSEKCSQTADEESSTSSSSINKYPIPPLPKTIINNSLRTQNTTNNTTNTNIPNINNTIEQGLLNNES